MYKMLGMNIIGRFCTKCSVVTLRNRTNYSISTPRNCAKRYQTCWSGDASKSTDDSLKDDFDFESASPYATVDLEAVAEGDPEKLKNLKLFQLEIDLMRQQGGRVPTRLSTRRWKDLLTLSSLAIREKYLKHLWTIEMKEKHRQQKSQMKAQLHAQFKATQQAPAEVLTTSSALNYNLCETSLFYRLRDHTMDRFYNYKLLLAEWFGPKILVDCSYEEFMALRNIESCVKQMLLMWSENRQNINPYDLIYCNVDPGGTLWRKFIQRIPTICEADSPVHFSQQHYLDMFPREKLVYLTPHCREVLEEYSHDDVYIIGGYVDACQGQPLSLAKAKKDKVRMAKLPLDRYLRWAVGHKNLPINQILAILNDLKDGLSWQVALKHVAKRKIAVPVVNFDEDEEKKLNYRTAKGIREDYRKHKVYDLLMSDRPDKGSEKK